MKDKEGRKKKHMIKDEESKTRHKNQEQEENQRVRGSEKRGIT